MHKEDICQLDSLHIIGSYMGGLLSSTGRHQFHVSWFAGKCKMALFCCLTVCRTVQWVFFDRFPGFDSLYDSQNGHI